MRQQDIPECACAAGPWLTTDVLESARYRGSPSMIRCPDSEYCLRGAEIVNGRIVEHPRNVPGVCPWTGVRVVESGRGCGCGPYITTRQLRIVMRLGGHPSRRIYAIGCPGGCRKFATVAGGRIVEHGYVRCPWEGVRVLDAGRYPPLFRHEDYR
jgi:hypothetical protein